MLILGCITLCTTITGSIFRTLSVNLQQKNVFQHIKPKITMNLLTYNDTAQMSVHQSGTPQHKRNGGLSSAYFKS